MVLAHLPAGSPCLMSLPTVRQLSVCANGVTERTYAGGDYSVAPNPVSSQYMLCECLVQLYRSHSVISHVLDCLRSMLRVRQLGVQWIYWFIYFSDYPEIYSLESFPDCAADDSFMSRQTLQHHQKLEFSAYSSPSMLAKFWSHIKLLSDLVTVIFGRYIRVCF